MPKEQIRKRGKRKPKNAEEDFASAPAVTEQTQAVSTEPIREEPPHLAAEAQAGQAGPSGIHPARAAILAGRRPLPSDIPAPEPVDDAQVLEWSRNQRDAEYPWGELDPDLKAYFRNVDDQIRDWEGVSSAGEDREDRQQFLSSVLAELRGHELTVSTDPDTAVVLERLMPSLGDWGRRVIGDAFGDQWDILTRHRFGSHVVQTWFTLAADTLDRESKGIYPPQHLAQEQSDETGVLPTMTTLVSKILNILQPAIPALLTNPHASPPLRLLLIVLTPTRVVPALNEAEEGKGGIIRSKKSGKYRKGQAVQGKSIFGDDEEKGKGKASSRAIPDELVSQKKEILDKLLKDVSEVEWRSMGVHGVGSAAVQLLLELESEDGTSGLLDVLTDGLVSQIEESSENPPTPKEYPATLLTTQSGTRLLETILVVSPLAVFQSMWTLYFVGKIGKFAGHPYANFVVAKGVARLDVEGVENVVKECRAVAGARGLIKTARTSVLQALVDRASKLTTAQQSVLSLIQSALDLPDTEKKNLVPCLMSLKTWPMYQSIKTGDPLAEEDTPEIPEEVLDPEAEAAAAAAARMEGWKTRRNPKAKEGDLSPNMQGCLLLQAMVKLPGSNEVVLESILAQDVSVLLEYASSPVASHLLDAALSSNAVSPKYRRKLLSAFLGHYRELAEDRMGSRVADTIWAKADGFMKEKIARSLIPDANALASSQYGRFLSMKLDLHLLERRPAEWREKQIGVTGGKAKPVLKHVPTPEEEAKKAKKRKEDRDEIDDLFENVEVKPKKSKVA